MTTGLFKDEIVDENRENLNRNLSKSVTPGLLLDPSSASFKLASNFTLF